MLYSILEETERLLRVQRVLLAQPKEIYFALYLDLSFALPAPPARSLGAAFFVWRGDLHKNSRRPQRDGYPKRLSGTPMID